MSPFNIGDRVVCLGNHPDSNDNIQIGSTGTVCRVVQDDDCGDIGVCWDYDVGGHDCKGACARGRGWFVRPYQIELDTTPDETFEFNEEDLKILFST